jgi:single-stranded-DNA-specific exonuclease
MNIQKRRDECSSIRDVVLANVDMTEEEFLRPEKDYHIDGLQEASDIIRNTISSGQPITLVGDYDADGICACAILKTAFKALGTNITVRLPKRFSEGYGLSEKIVSEIDAGLLLTVDNGIAAYDAIEKAKEKGLTVIVTDHHLAPEDKPIPNADVVIDPNALPGTATFEGYCGAGLALKLSIELLGESHAIIPKLKSFAAIATIADVMKLTEENRLIVKEGLANMVTYKGRTTGLGALLESCGMDRYIDAKNIGFKIGPMINAPGRLFDDGAQTSFEMLSFNSTVSEAKAKALDIVNINEQRKALKEEGLQKVRENIVENCYFGDPILIIYEPGLPEGLAGIFAGKMAEEHKVPCFVFTDNEHDADSSILKGSGRTYGDINIKELLDSNASYLEKFGGHAEAAGVSLKKENLDDFRNAMISCVPKTDNDDGVLYYDLEIQANKINDVLEELDKFAPFGEGNPEIVFHVKNFNLSPGMGGYYRTMGDNNQHIKLLGDSAVAVGFDLTEKFVQMGEPKTVNIVGTVSKNYFNGKFTTQIEILDFEDSYSAVAKTPMASLLADMASKRYK